MEIALSCWHGNGRTTTVREIEEHCENNVKNLLKNFQDSFQSDSQGSITRLLTAFYFRESGDLRGSEKTFEFTHKSFGEYLTARRIIDQVKQIHKKLQNREKDHDYDYNPNKKALIAWATLCGPTAIDEYLFSFIVNQMQLQSPDEVKQWQKTLGDLIKYLLVKGMPMEGLKNRPNFQEEMRQARNAEEALLAVFNACGRVTKEIFPIQWPSPEAFGNWLARLQGQRIDFEPMFVLNCLSFLDLQNCLLICRDLFRANLVGANLVGANLAGAILGWADIEYANLARADIEYANLYRANLEGANLRGANLYGANLERANLERANLEGAFLDGANLEGANLEGAFLDGANLEGANLERANLVGAFLVGANLVGANLEGANFKDANVKGTILDTEVKTE